MANARSRSFAIIFLLLGASVALTACDPAPENPVPTSSESHEAVEEPTPEPTPEGPLAVVTVAGIDVDGEHVSASGYVADIVEDGGTCLFTFTGPSDSVTAESTGVANVSDTSCGLVQVESSSFTRGSWSVVLTYTSDNTQTASEPVALEIP